jgi:hypothetical protein
MTVKQPSVPERAESKGGKRAMKQRTWKPLWAALALAFAALPGWANAQSGEFVDGVLQPLEDGFPNRPITLVVNDDAGSAEGIMARQLQAALEKISPVPILVSDEPHATGGTFDKLKELERRDGGVDGYYPVAVNVYGASTDTLVADIKGDLGLTLEDMIMVAVLEAATMVVVQRKDPPWVRPSPIWSSTPKSTPASSNTSPRRSAAATTSHSSSLPSLREYGIISRRSRMWTP